MDIMLYGDEGSVGIIGVESEIGETFMFRPNLLHLFSH